MAESTKGKQLVTAIVVFLVAVGLTKVYLDAEIERMTPSEPQKVVTVRKGVNAGAAVTEANLAPLVVPRKWMPRGAIPWEDRQQYVGEEVTVNIQDGDYLVSSYFDVRQAVGNTLSQQIDGENFRAISLPVDETNSLARSIVTGDHIDIVFTFNVPGVGTKVSIVLLQNVPVIATGTYSVVDEELGARSARIKRYNSLTLKLTAEDAFRLNYARQMGKVSILLRNTKDGNVADFKPVAGVQDILLPADKELISRMISAAQNPDRAQMQEQIKQLFDASRKQQGK